MPLAAEDVKKLGDLARLEIADDQIDAYRESLSRILEFVERLAAVDTAGVAPMAHPLVGMTARLRADEVSEPNRRELYQKNAPAVEDGLYLVPSVID